MDPLTFYVFASLLCDEGKALMSFKKEQLCVATQSDELFACHPNVLVVTPTVGGD